MHAGLLMRWVLSAFAATFGGFGVFLAVCSFSAPHLAALAAFFLGAASAIVYWLDA